MWAGGQVQAPGWSDQELLLLLEGVELYGDSWADIAEHVGTKSQARLPPAPSPASLVRQAGSALLGRCLQAAVRDAPCWRAARCFWAQMHALASEWKSLVGSSVSHGLLASPPPAAAESTPRARCTVCGTGSSWGARARR